MNQGNQQHKCVSHVEFHYAANGNVVALREWLRKHPERVNIPKPGSMYTLLSTAVNCCRLEVVQMLVGEFHADMGIPCGGIGNTCVHTAASKCSVDILSYLLSCSPPLRPNAFMEYPRDIAEAANANKESKEKCVAMLRAYEETSGQPRLKQETGSSAVLQSLPQHPPQLPRQSSSLALSRPLGTPATIEKTALRDLIREVKLDDDEDEGSGASCQTSHMWLEKRRQSQAPSPLLSTLHGHRDDLAGKGGLDANCGRPRNERSLNTQTNLPLDLREFRRQYGGSFDFIEDTHRYVIRGLLPYTFKECVYYTPVIITLCKPTDAAGDESVGSQQDFHSDCQSGRPPPVARYRALIDRKRLGTLFISRRATYIDPCTAAIIPSAVDAYYRNLLDFVRYAVLDNFERIPPLTSSSNESRAVQDGVPLFSLYPRQREATLRIMRELSLFGDGALTYDCATFRVEGFLPLFVPLASSSGGGGGGRDAHAAGKVVINAASSPPLEDHGARTKDSKIEAMLAGDLIMKLQLRVQFDANSNFENPPRVYFTNATTNTLEPWNSYEFLSQIIFDSTCGEVCCGKLSSLAGWKEHGSLLTVLVELQQKATSLLMEYCTTSALCESSKGEAAAARKGDPVCSTTPSTSMQYETPSVDRTGLEEDMGFILVGRPTTGTAEALAADNNSNNDNNDRWTLVSHGDDTGTASMCVFCAEAERNIVLLPCRHLVLCRACSLRYRDRLADAMLCPICRTPTETVLEVFS
ncbi:hypothetical protein TraAM80_03321 [Trypanosoma rangeli]|uniref:RING-type domain-containing protein n=1 Tax=Trypanosoma rangeli TaxID=5698 RepID=A0A3R7M1K8_TRYRA|nr:uncharacterized protein TraAM80_03321 [Trypanosoma rangeli]RNF07353.1 hypothetical protein TraAM80_03321 [Trypanosoma rangeli]|eukprot:RNF07353.1 hypothetical protein TraAM80_03321 [Trypanosoma rangeli]